MPSFKDVEFARILGSIASNTGDLFVTMQQAKIGSLMRNVDMSARKPHATSKSLCVNIISDMRFAPSRLDILQIELVHREGSPFLSFVRLSNLCPGQGTGP